MNRDKLKEMRFPKSNTSFENILDIWDNYLKGYYDILIKMKYQSS